MSIQRVRSKQAKTDVLLADPELRSYIPATERFDRSTVQRMLDRYGMIYAKPVNGTFGSGVIRIERDLSDSLPYRFQSGETRRDFEASTICSASFSYDEKKKPIWPNKASSCSNTGKKIRLAHHGSEKPARKWEATGMIGRVAHPRKIVTNYHAGGTPLPVPKLLSGYLSGDRLRAYERRLRKLGVSVAEALEKKYPGLKEIGIDVAVDQAMKPWILEVNTLPDPFLFRKLPDRSVFRTIYAYAVAYGRFKTRKRRA